MLQWIVQRIWSERGDRRCWRARPCRLSSPSGRRTSFLPPFFESKVLLAPEKISNLCHEKYPCRFKLTKSTASLVAAMMISAQETTPGHALSTAALAWSRMSYPLTLRLGGAVFSLDGPSRSSDASHPFKICSQRIHIKQQ